MIEKPKVYVLKPEHKEFEKITMCAEALSVSFGDAMTIAIENEYRKHNQRNLSDDFDVINDMTRELTPIEKLHVSTPPAPPEAASLAIVFGACNR